MSIGRQETAFKHCLSYFMWGVVKEKCYAGKPDTIEGQLS